MTLSTNEQLVFHLQQTGVLKTPAIINAFKAIDRSHFVPPEYAMEQYGDYPLPIGYGQTISQPTTVAFMLEQLQPQRGERILDVGSGSGWTTALLAHIVGESGHVVGMEIVPELVAEGQRHLANFGFSHTEIRQATLGALGAPKDALFDRILVSAAAREYPVQIEEQLNTPGILVLPIQDTVWKIEKDASGKIQKRRFPGFVFVPLKM